MRVVFVALVVAVMGGCAGEWQGTRREAGRGVAGVGYVGAAGRVAGAVWARREEVSDFEVMLVCDYLRMEMEGRAARAGEMGQRVEAAERYVRELQELADGLKGREAGGLSMAIVEEAVAEGRVVVFRMRGGERIADGPLAWAVGRGGIGVRREALEAWKTGADALVAAIRQKASIVGMTAGFAAVARRGMERRAAGEGGRMGAAAGFVSAIDDARRARVESATPVPAEVKGMEAWAAGLEERWLLAAEMVRDRVAVVDAAQKALRVSREAEAVLREGLEREGLSVERLEALLRVMWEVKGLEESVAGDAAGLVRARENFLFELRRVRERFGKGTDRGRVEYWMLVAWEERAARVRGGERMP